jgi:serine/threonine-protein kinase HipA
VAERKRTRARKRESGYILAEVSLWGLDVGAVAEDRTGRVTFEYDEEFRRSGLEISPIQLPLSTRGPREFASLRRRTTFAGLPGVLADALPDAFGNAVIKRYFEERGDPDAALSPVQKLLYIGSRAMGALEFGPALPEARTEPETEALEIARLVEQARRVIEGDTTVAVREMMQVGGSAGGARAKALILWDRKLNRARSAFAPREPGEEHWIIKFDGVSDGSGGHELRADLKPGPYGRIEYAYAQMARTAGLEMMPSHLLLDGEYAHFLTQRFDRVGDERLHFHSLGGLHHVDYNDRGAFSYEEYLRTVRLLGMGQPSVNEAYRRTVFNLATVNQDDHVKNLGFLMDREGKWRLSPAYDVTFARGSEWTRTHQMTLAGKDDNFTRDELLKLGAAMDVPADGARIIDDVEGSLALWEKEAAAVDVPRAWQERVAALFRHFV